MRTVQPLPRLAPREVFYRIAPRWLFCLTLALLALSAPAALANPSCNPDQILQRFRGELSRQDWSSAQRDSLAAHVLGTAATGVNLFNFVHQTTGGSYQVMARRLVQGKVLDTVVLPNGASRDHVRLMAAMVAERRPITDRLVGPVNKLGGYLKALQIGRDLTNAIGGDDAAKLNLIKAAYDQQFSAATAFAATRSLQAAMGSVAFLNYALTTFITKQYADYEQFWWESYSRYHNKVHREIVTGSHSWVALIERGGHAEVEKRLHSFWNDPLENAAHHYRKPGPLQSTGLSIATFRVPFAARYYRDSLHPTLKTYFQRKAREAANEAYFEAEQACREVDTAGRAIAALQTLLADDGSALEQAILKSDAEAVRRLLADGADVNAIRTTASGQRYPLVWLAALTSGRPGMLQILDLMLATGRASTALPAGQKNSLVFLTLHNKFYEPAARLIRAGFPAEFNVGREQPMLVLFARSGDARAVGTLLDARIDPNQAIAGGTTALMFAAYEGHLDVVRLLVERGADPRRANDKGVTVLRHAEHRGHKAVADYLRSVLGEPQGKMVGEVGHRDPDGKPIRPRYTLDSAFVGHLLPVAGMLPPLKWHVAAEPAANLLLELGESDAYHRIYFEMQPRQVGPVRLALQVTDSAGNTARTDLSLTIDETREALEGRVVEASKTGDWSTVRRILGEHPGLINRCVRTTAQGGDSRCPAQGSIRGIKVASVVMINAAASIDDPSLVRLLIANGADPNARTSQGVPVVLLALAAGNRGMVDALLAAKADPNQPGPQGLTLLHVAAMRGDLALAERLIAAGARPQPDAHGRMPGYYMFWLHGGDPAVAERLGYGEGRGYVERRERREREAAAAAEFAKVMLQATAAAVQQHQQARSAARQPAAGGPIQGPVRGTMPVQSNPLRIAEPGSARPRAAPAPSGGGTQQDGGYRGPCYDPNVSQAVATGKRADRVHPNYVVNAPVLSKSDIYVLRRKGSPPIDGVARRAGCFQEATSGISTWNREFYSWPITVCGKTVYVKSRPGPAYLENPRDPYREFICKN